MSVSDSNLKPRSSWGGGREGGRRRNVCGGKKPWLKTDKKFLDVFVIGDDPIMNCYKSCRGDRVKMHMFNQNKITGSNSLLCCAVGIPLSAPERCGWLLISLGTP